MAQTDTGLPAPPDPSEPVGAVRDAVATILIEGGNMLQTPGRIVADFGKTIRNIRV